MIWIEAELLTDTNRLGDTTHESKGISKKNMQKLQSDQATRHSQSYMYK